MNLNEAEHALNRGDEAKALEHAELATELAEDDILREKARLFVNRVTSDLPEKPVISPAHSCSGCSPSHHDVSPTDDFSSDFLSMAEQFELLIHPLPGDLPERYRQMGEKFAYAYIAVHNDRTEEGIKIFKELSSHSTSDILDYEIALIDFRQGRLDECEQGLRRAISRNSGNPLCFLGLVQLLVETERLQEAMSVLERMISDGHLPDQATLILGDLLLMTGNSQAALENYISALDFPAVAKSAAQKAVPLLEEFGRSGDAQALAKRYLKGCC
jgi:pentatricopeptide repeat protein